MPNYKKLLVLTFALTFGGTCYAHDGYGNTANFFSGFLHPFNGLDHLLAAFAVGLIAANLTRSQLPSRVAMLPSIAFLSSALLGSAFGTQSGAFAPGMEWLVIGSLVFFGAILMINRGHMLILILTACGLFGFAHGYVHTAELASSVKSVEYALIEYELGWLIATTLIHATGFVVSAMLLRNYQTIQRLAGALIALTGLVLSAALMGVSAI